MKSESTLHQLKAAVPSGQLPSSYGVYFKNTLVALCHALEDHILQTAQVPVTQKPLVLVTFQQGKWYLQEANRYGDIAVASRYVVICAVPESGFSSHRTSQLDNVSTVDLNPSDSLVNEWNLVILAPAYQAMVLCHELAPEEYPPQGVPQVDTERKFYGLWTFDQNLVQKAAEILIHQLYFYNPTLGQSVQTLYQEILQTPAETTVDLSHVVSRIITYLQSSQQQLIAVHQQTRKLWELEGQALRVSRNLNANKLQAFLRMAGRVDERDPTNPIASLQVAALAETLGQLLDLPTVKLRRLRLAGLLFRVGLISAPTEIFTQAPSEFDDAIRAFWEERVAISSQLLTAIPELEGVTNIVAHSLEYWDGTGRPHGWRGEEIPIESRILGLVSEFQELTQPRGSRPAFSLGEALAQCQKLQGSRFDPTLVESLSTVVRLTEMGMMQLPDRPSQLPNVWLEEGCRV